MWRILWLWAIAIPLMAQVPTPQINLTGNIGCQGFPCLNSGTVVFHSDADQAMAINETSATGGIKVTSAVLLTGTRNLIAPLGNFQFMAIENSTTGGQSIQIIGPSGTGVIIPNGKAASVWFDGTNYIQIGFTSAGGTVTNFSVGSWPSWLSPSVSNATTTPSLAVSSSAIPNSALANTSTTVNGQTCTLGSSCTVSAGGNTSAMTLTYIGSSGGSVNCGSSTTCTASRGYVVIHMPSSTAPGDYVQATFGTAYSSNPTCIVTQNGGGSSPTDYLNAGGRATTTDLFFFMGNSPTASGVYTFAYICTP